MSHYERSKKSTKSETCEKLRIWTNWAILHRKGKKFHSRKIKSEQLGHLTTQGMVWTLKERRQKMYWAFLKTKLKNIRHWVNFTYKRVLIPSKGLVKKILGSIKAQKMVLYKEKNGTLVLYKKRRAASTKRASQNLKLKFSAFYFFFFLFLFV